MMNKSQAIVAGSIILIVGVIGGYLLSTRHNQSLNFSSQGNQNTTYSTSPTQIMQSNQQVTGIPPKGNLCDASDLQAKAGWQGAGGSLLGGIQVTNKSTTACSLPWKMNPQVQIIDGQGHVLPVTVDFDQKASCDEQTSPYKCPPGTSFPLLPGQSASVPLQWNNWCKPQPQGSLGLLVTLPYNREKLTAPILDVTGKQLDDTPVCEIRDNSGQPNPNSPSGLTVGIFAPQHP